MNRFASNYNYNSLADLCIEACRLYHDSPSPIRSRRLLATPNGNNVRRLENWSNLGYNYGSLSNDRRHAFVATFVIQATGVQGA